MTIYKGELLTLSVMWGHFDRAGRWCYNPALPLTEVEQRADNIKHGFITPEGFKK